MDLERGRETGFDSRAPGLGRAPGQVWAEDSPDLGARSLSASCGQVLCGVLGMAWRKPAPWCSGCSRSRGQVNSSAGACTCRVPGPMRRPRRSSGAVPLPPSPPGRGRGDRSAQKRTRAETALLGTRWPRFPFLLWALSCPPPGAAVLGGPCSAVGLAGSVPVWGAWPSLVAGQAAGGGGGRGTGREPALRGARSVRI